MNGSSEVPAGGTGRYGRFGGRYVPETLMEALIRLDGAFTRAMGDPAFRQELTGLLTHYAGRPTPLTFCPNLSARLGAGST
jgi:tryptophan synthase beta chain